MHYSSCQCQSVIGGSSNVGGSWHCFVCSWLELDQNEVVELKGRLLDAAGAGTKHEQGYKYPLKAGSYVSAVVNLNDASWPEQLAQAGKAASSCMHTVQDCELRIYVFVHDQCERLGVSHFALSCAFQCEQCSGYLCLCRCSSSSIWLLHCLTSALTNHIEKACDC